MRLDALTIPHDAQRYNTVGDYYVPYQGHLRIRISELGNADYEFLILIHELVEAYFCQRAGISEAEITSWDLAHMSADEPGALPDAPYHKQHMIATTVEVSLASLLEVDWTKYDAAIAALTERGQGPDAESLEETIEKEVRHG